MDRTLVLIGRAHQGDKAARDLLFEENTGLIYSVAKRFLGRGVEMEDLFQTKRPYTVQTRVRSKLLLFTIIYNILSDQIRHFFYSRPFSRISFKASSSAPTVTSG